MMRICRTLAAFLRASIGVMLTYRGEIILWALWGLVNPAVFYALWSAAAQSSTGGQIADFDRGQIAAYYFAVMIVGHLTTAWDIYEMSYLVRSGQMSPRLLRPILPIWQAIADNMAYKITTLAFVLPMWGLFAWLVQPTFTTAAWQLGLGLVATLLAAVLYFMLNYTLSLITFWFTKLEALGEVFFALGMFLGGRVAPLEALPAILYQVALYLPFRWMMAFPAELLMGAVADPRDALIGIAIQGAWLVASIFAFRILWSLAVRHYAAVNG